MNFVFLFYDIVFSFPLIPLINVSKQIFSEIVPIALFFILKAIVEKILYPSSTESILVDVLPELKHQQSGTV